MKIIISLFLTIIVMSPVFAETGQIDTIRLAKSLSKQDSRLDYANHIIELALRTSAEKYGDYRIINSEISGTRDRMLRELQKGITINVHSAPTRPEWEEKAIPVMFPIKKGLLSYRVFLIHKDNQEMFANVQSVDELKQLVAGLGEQWSTTKALRKLGTFQIETSLSYEGLFEMLMAKRFDYFIRGVNEVYRELEERSEKFPDMMIEPSIALDLPLPWFIFVSPKYERLAERIGYGLHQMKLNGEFEKEFRKYHQASIDKANLSSRKLFRIENKMLNPHPIYQDPSYWLNPLEK